MARAHTETNYFHPYRFQSAAVVALEVCVCGSTTALQGTWKVCVNMCCVEEHTGSLWRQLNVVCVCVVVRAHVLVLRGGGWGSVQHDVIKMFDL